MVESERTDDKAETETMAAPDDASEPSPLSGDERSLRERMGRVRALTHAAHVAPDRERARELLVQARAHLAGARETFETNPSKLRASLAPLVLVTSEALDELSCALNAIALLRGC